MGKPLGGSAPYGYQWTDGALVLHPDEAPVRALMYELFAKTQRIGTVARQLSQRGQRTRKGKAWSATTVRNLLVDPISKGLRRTNYTFQDPKTGQTRTKPESGWIYVQVEPVVTEELWAQVNSVLDARSEQRRLRPGRKSRHVFTGLVRCECSQKMYVPSRTTNYRCKSCGNSIPCDDLEAIFLEKLREWLTPETVAAVLLQTDQMVPERKGLLEGLHKQLSEVQAQMDRLFELHAEGELPTRGFKRRYDPPRGTLSATPEGGGQHPGRARLLPGGAPQRGASPQ